MLCVVAPVLHMYVPPPVAVSMAEDPVYMVPSFGTVPELSLTEILGVGTGRTVIVVEVVAVHPLAFVTVTVYVPVVPVEIELVEAHSPNIGCSSTTQLKLP